ncbi:hypothetical protein F6Q07_23035 [Pectobacterium parmentieri]|uniref:hypothetical protein n=1 Tax=Pectobacterium parmentieri TaxID=1905730 RepID=UPI000EB47D0E|nr:hypothetical protein [Pectobacterium parmentieri]AYG99806.1 hypothetical protein C5E26_01820 [Pectobacterium parmentieri]AYH26044.1 hypothetical protein C5E20_02025 [Pectobacterium parmentieri]AYH30498.1 hypothetical protein C5E19_01815 [Pectobacterium parmentieri]MBI0520926.1 hypothetical protein [Pectobacterium parmentieri]MBI0552778.1 hypothetical protein [Pectobacterium parmentieri]
MSIEYIVHIDDKRDDSFPLIVNGIKSVFSSSQVNGDALWIPCDNSEWVYFSIEKYENGFFILNNLNGIERDRLFSVITSVFDELSIKYEIEEI